MLSFLTEFKMNQVNGMLLSSVSILISPFLSEASYQENKHNLFKVGCVRACSSSCEH